MFRSHSMRRAKSRNYNVAMGLRWIERSTVKTLYDCERHLSFSSLISELSLGFLLNTWSIIPFRRCRVSIDSACGFYYVLVARGERPYRYSVLYVGQRIRRHDAKK